MSIGLKFLNGSQEGNIVPVSKDKFIIGRELDCTLRLAQELVSRHHCAIIQDGYTIRLRDLGSKNGSFINGHRISSDKELKDRDIITVGGIALQLNMNCVIPEQSLEDTNTIHLENTSIHKQDTEITKLNPLEETKESDVPEPIVPNEGTDTVNLVPTNHENDDEMDEYELEPDNG